MAHAPSTYNRPITPTADQGVWRVVVDFSHFGQKTAGKLEFENWIGARGASCPRTAPTRGCSRVARRGPTIGHRPMHRTLPETSPVVLALLRGLNPPVTPALASSAPAAGPIFYHFRATERHLLPTHQPLAPATLHDSPCFRGLLSWIWVRIDEYPLAAPSFSKRDRAPGARSDCTRERRRVAGFRSLWRAQLNGRLSMTQCPGARSQRVE